MVFIKMKAIKIVRLNLKNRYFIFLSCLGVIVLGATNRRDDLDKALLRPGRFDVEVQVPVPDYSGRKEILQHYLSKIKLAEDVDIDLLARGTTGFTGADIENLVNQVFGSCFLCNNFLQLFLYIRNDVGCCSRCN